MGIEIATLETDGPGMVPVAASAEHGIRPGVEREFLNRELTCPT